MRGAHPLRLARRDPRVRRRGLRAARPQGPAPASCSPAPDEVAQHFETASFALSPKPPRELAAKPLPAERDVIAVDGTDVRILLRTERGSTAHFEFGPGRTSRAIRHHTVEEVWYFSPVGPKSGGCAGGDERVDEVNARQSARHPGWHRISSSGRSATSRSSAHAHDAALAERRRRGRPRRRPLDALLVVPAVVGRRRRSPGRRPPECRVRAPGATHPHRTSLTASVPPATSPAPPISPRIERRSPSSPGFRDAHARRTRAGRRCMRRARAGRTRIAAAGRASGVPGRRSPRRRRTGCRAVALAVPGMNCAIPCAPARLRRTG